MRNLPHARTTLRNYTEALAYLSGVEDLTSLETVAMPDSANPTRPIPDKFLVAFSFAGAQREFVRGIAEEVERILGRGTVFYDEWFENYLAGYDADLKLQQIYAQRCDLAVICVSERYGDKPWTLSEHQAIRARLMESRSSDDPRDRAGILPIRVGGGDVRGIFFDAIVPDVRDRSPVEAAELIVTRLQLITPTVESALGIFSPGASWPETPPDLVWNMAGHNAVRQAFASLLTWAAPWRYLALRGPSEIGKSHITREMFVNALSIRDIACGRFDFKGTTAMDTEIRTFVQELGVPVSEAGARLQERLSHILASLRKRGRPTLLIFDTYEMAVETEQWMEEQLLPSLIRAHWLRVVIAGQTVPDPTGAIWAAVACPTIQLVPPSPKDWFDYSKQHRGDLTLVDVETVCRLASDKASVLAQLLGAGV